MKSATFFNPKLSLDFEQVAVYGEQIASEWLEGVAGYAERQSGARCRKKRQDAEEIVYKALCIYVTS